MVEADERGVGGAAGVDERAVGGQVIAREPADVVRQAGEDFLVGVGVVGRVEVGRVVEGVVIVDHAGAGIGERAVIEEVVLEGPVLVRERLADEAR